MRVYFATIWHPPSRFHTLPIVRLIIAYFNHASYSEHNGYRCEVAEFPTLLMSKIFLTLRLLIFVYENVCVPYAPQSIMAGISRCPLGSTMAAPTKGLPYLSDVVGIVNLSALFSELYSTTLSSATCLCCCVPEGLLLRSLSIP